MARRSIRAPDAHPLPTLPAPLRFAVALISAGGVAPEVFVIRYLGGAGGDRLLVVNLGRDLDLVPAPLHSDAQCHVPGEAAVLLTSRAGFDDDHE